MECCLFILIVFYFILYYIKFMKKFEHIDHTADAGIKVYGNSLKEVFENAALGLFDIIANLEKVRDKTERSLEVEGVDRENLLVNWLSELNYLFFTEKEIYRDFQIKTLNDSTLTAKVKGEKLDTERHEIYTEVKAVTYHGLYIKETDEGWEAQIIFDL